jgi:hypothetical protein
VKRTNFHSAVDQLTFSLAHASRMRLFRSLINGFFLAIRPNRLFSQSRRRIVLVEMFTLDREA